MTEMLEIRWHGRGGQGAKTAALLLADAAFDSGKYVQGFPEYGPERMGAPITAYNRISTEPIKIHSNIYEPDFIAVVDETLITSVNVTLGLKEGGAIIVNSEKSAKEIKSQFNELDRRVYVIDARKISEETLGRNFPNTPMLGAVVKISGIIPETDFIETMKASFDHKFASKPEVIEGNMKALIRAMQEVQSDEN